MDTINDRRRQSTAAGRGQVVAGTLTEIATTDPRSMLVPLSPPPSTNGNGEAADDE